MHERGFESMGPVSHKRRRDMRNALHESDLHVERKWVQT